MARRNSVITLLLLLLSLAGSCGPAGRRPVSGSRPSGEGQSTERDAGPTARQDASSATSRETGGQPPPGAQAIRDIDWEGVDCRGESPLERALRLDFDPTEGWQCRVTSLDFADLTGDGIEEAVVGLEFRLTVVEQLGSGRTSERRMRSDEHVVISLHEDRPELLVHVSSGNDVISAEPSGSDLRVELEECGECGCETFEEYWVWDGRRFSVDEARSRLIGQPADCDSL